MLRIIVISLVVANLLLLGFQSSAPTVQPEARTASTVVKDSGIPTIHLFSEMMQDQGLMSGSRRCFTLGPFHSVADWDDVHLRLQEVATRISERQTEALVEKGYWVFMPPYPSLLEANEALLSLQALGLEDVAIMYDGEWKNSISLGYFMRQENAQRRKKALEDRGFNPKMRIQRQAEPRFWLDYEQEPGSGLVELDMQNRPNDFMQRPVPCPEAEFLEADALASQETGDKPVQPQVSEAESKPLTNVEEGPDGPGSTEQPAQALDRPGVHAREANLETGPGPEAGDATDNAQVINDGGATEGLAGEQNAPETATEPDEALDANGATVKSQAPAAAAGKAAEPPTDGETEKTTGDDVETLSGEVSENATGSDDKAATVESTGDAGGTKAEPTSKLTVGTGPAHIVSTEPGPDETSVKDQDAVNPAAGASEIKAGDGGEEPADAGNEETTASPPGGSGEHNVQEGKAKDNGNGTGTVDG